MKIKDIFLKIKQEIPGLILAAERIFNARGTGKFKLEYVLKELGKIIPKPKLIPQVFWDMFITLIIDTTIKTLNRPDVKGFFRVENIGRTTDAISKTPR